VDQFERTFLPVSAKAGIEITRVSRHIPMLRRCIAPDDSAVLVARCTRVDRPLRGEHLMVATQRRLVITHDSPILRRMRLHLNSPLAELSDVQWLLDARLTAIEFAATASDGVRERFLIKAVRPRDLWRIEASFVELFRRWSDDPAAPGVPFTAA
jgi:hypothetical protein